MMTREIACEPEFTWMDGRVPDTGDKRLAPRDFPHGHRPTPEFLRRHQALVQVFWSEHCERCVYVILQLA